MALLSNQNDGVVDKFRPKTRARYLELRTDFITKFPLAAVEIMKFMDHYGMMRMFSGGW